MHEIIKKKINSLTGILIVFILSFYGLLFIIDKFELEKNIRVFDYIFGIGTAFLILTAIIAAYLTILKKPKYLSRSQNEDKHQNKHTNKHSDKQKQSIIHISHENIEEQKLIAEITAIIALFIFILYLPLLQKYIDAWSIGIILIISFILIKLAFYYLFDLAIIEKEFKERKQPQHH